MLLSAEQLSINFGMRQLLEDVNFYLKEGDKTGIIGINGTGKSTFLRVLAGQAQPDGGKITLNPNARLSFLPQNPPMDDSATVLEQVFLHMPADFQSVHEYEAKAMLSKLGISDYQQKIGTLSGGQRKRTALAAVLIQPADILILDEPTNHLDAAMTLWLEDWLRRFKGGLVMVTHDRYFLERVVNHITELDHGKLYHYEANYSKYLEHKQQRQDILEAGERKRQSILRTEREWIQRGCQARTTKSKDRVERYEALLSQKAPEQEDSLQLSAAASRLGKKILEMDHVSISFQGRPILKDFSNVLLREDRIGIIGSNGAGKSTLLNLIAGKLKPDSGTIELGTTVKIGYFSQEGRELNLNERVYDFIHEIASQVKTPEGTFTATQMMERFLFPRYMQSVPIGRLSGGERRRLYLLSVLMEAPNLLLLDEPTNDLDIMTLSILEDYLQSFPGPILAVSHDRFFLDKLAQSIWEIPGDGQILRYTGNWSDWNRKAGGTARESKPEKEKAPQRVRKQRLKFSYKEQREFDTIEDDLSQLEARISSCQAEQVQCGSDYIRLQELQQEESELQQQLDEKTERWLYLTDLKERIDAQSEGEPL